MSDFIPIRGARDTRFTSSMSPSFPIWADNVDYTTNQVVMYDTDNTKIVKHRLYSATENIDFTAVNHYTLTFTNTGFDNSAFNGLVTIGGSSINIGSGDTVETVAQKFAEQYTKDSAFRAKYIGNNIVDIANTNFITTPLTDVSITGINIIGSTVENENLSPDVNALWSNIDEESTASGTNIGVEFTGGQNIKGYYTVESGNSEINGCLVPIFTPSAADALQIRWSNNLTTASVFETITDVYATLDSSVTQVLNSDFNPLLADGVTLDSFTTTLPVTLSNGTTVTATSNTITRYTPYFYGFDLNNLTASTTDFIIGQTDIPTGPGTESNFYIAIEASINIVTTLSLRGFDLTIAAPTIVTNIPNTNNTSYNLYTLTGVSPDIILGDIR